MKCLAKKKFYCPILKRYVEKGETVEIDKKHIEGYLPYVEIIEKVETAKKVDKRTPTQKKVK